MADSAQSPPVDAADKSRPQKPDEVKYKSDLAEAEKAHEAAQARFNASRAKLDNARPGKSSPANDRFKSLVDDQKSIRTKQQENKSVKSTQQEKFNRNDAEIKKLIAEQKEARSRAGFKNVEEIDAKIDSIMKQVDSGQMKLVDEKKALTEVSNLRRQKKGFTGLDDLQKKIDEKKTENTELKKTFDNPESRALAQKYEDNQKELDEIKAAREGTNKNFDTLKAEREKLYNEQQTTYGNIRKIKDDYYGQRKAYKEHEDQVYQQRRERQKAEKDAYEKEKRRRIADQKLEEAGEPAFLDQIRTAEGLIRHFDPSYSASESDKSPSAFAATAQRVIDEVGFKGMKVMKKEDEDFFVGSGGKKKGKGKKPPPDNGTASEAGKLNMNIGIIEELAKVGVDPPSTQADVSGVVEKLKENLEGWKKDQDAQTQKNVEKAKKDIERLEKEAAEASTSEAPKSTRRTDRPKKVSQKNANDADMAAEAEEAGEKDTAADVANELKQAKLEDKKNEAVATA